VIGQARFHRGGNAQTRIHTAEVVIRKMQGNGGFQIRQLLAERIGKPRQSSHLHSNRQVLPLDVASRNVPRIRIASPHLGYNRDDWAWGVPRSRVMLPIVPVQLGQLGEANIQPKRFRHCRLVEVEAISRDLRAVRVTFAGNQDKGEYSKSHALAFRVCATLGPDDYKSH